ncbi:MAG TPA: hypothetical protein VD883_02765 [Candidatus Omnitrophota bacterium]|nr:hypothetical protein [Candidatus Omnitrophota bacterium]
MSADGKSTIAWWIGWMTVTILSFFAAAWFWTVILARTYGPMSKPGGPLVWVICVFGTWMVLLVPLIVIMYQKVDKAYEDARISRETREYEKAKSNFRVRSVDVPESARLLPKELSVRLKTIPQAVKNGHLVTVLLKDGRRFENVFIKDRREVLGIYGAEAMPFEVSQISAFEPADLDRLPKFTTEGWLRLDGVGA